MSQPEAQRQDEVKRLEFLFRALRYRNYRLYFGGQSISLIGTWLTRVATSWLVYRLTDSALLLGMVGFAGQIPTFLLAPLAGVLVDRWDRHRILVITQTLSMSQSLMLAILALMHVIAVWHIIVLSIFQGIINAFDTPARQAFVVDMVEQRDDVANAIAMNSSMFNAARLLGPSLAGVLIATVGEGICFLLDGISYLAVIASLWAMKLTPRKIESQRTRVLEGLKEGFTYAFGFAPIKAILMLIGLVSLMGMPYVVLMPVIARDVLRGGPHTFGFLMAASGVGALAGAIYMASRKSIRGLGSIMTLSASLFGLGLIALALSRAVWLSLIVMFVTGFGMIVQMAAGNTVLQTIVEDDKRGRVMSFYTMAFLGMAPFGSLFAGGLASQIGAPNTILLGGVFCIFGSILFARKLPSLREIVRPIYVRKGIIEEVASGIQAATQ
ncbi:MAG: MFS transporter [Acidobacteriota bacterium]|nr:MFS transporter [Acidobacteriota bacterium]